MNELLDMAISSREGETAITLTMNIDGDIKSYTVPSSDTLRYKNLVALAMSYGVADTDEEREKITADIAEALDAREALKNLLAEHANNNGNVYSFEGSSVLLNGEPLDKPLADHLMRVIDEDGSVRNKDVWEALTQFIERLRNNVSPFVRDQLLNWLEAANNNDRGFTISKDGMLMGYKGFRLTDGVAYSSYKGEATVVNQDGTITHFEHDYIPNRVGDTVSMPRHRVQDNPSIGCSVGLHVGTYDYAYGYARDVVYLVEVDPADVVSVPTECDSQKIRASKYKVVQAVTEVKRETVYSWDEEDEDEYGEENYCECGELNEDCYCKEHENSEERVYIDSQGNTSCECGECLFDEEPAQSEALTKSFLETAREQVANMTPEESLNRLKALFGKKSD